MALFKRRPETPSWGDEVAGLSQLAATRGWQPRTEPVLSSSLADLVHRLSWIVYDRQYATSVYQTTSVQHQTVYRDAYGGRVDDRGVVVANAWTNIGPQQVVKLLKMVGVAVCAVLLGSRSLSPRSGREVTVSR